MSRFDPRLEVLPASQRGLWNELRQVPGEFVLYGGTAIALWLGHRVSEDFDFFSSKPFVPMDLLAMIPFLSGGVPVQSAPNTVTLILRGKEPVKISFFGGLTFGRVGQPARARENEMAVASRLDLAATKAKVVAERAERKDYLDIAALLKSGIMLSDALGAARALYGETFNPMITLKALSYFADGDLPKLPDEVKGFLSQQASQITAIPDLARVSNQIAPGD